MRVLFLSNIPSPYRMAFFNELGKLCDLTVAFEGMKATDRNSKWHYEKANNFKCVFMKGIRTRSDQFFCLEVLKILKKKFDFIIIGGYSTPTGMLAIEYLKMRKKEFFIEADGGFISHENWIKLKIKRHLISSASAWFSSGSETTDYLVYYGAVQERVYVYPFTSIKKDEIITKVPTRDEKRELRRELGLEGNKVVLSIGQFIERKGFDVLLKAATKLDKDINIYIIGDKPKKEYLQYQKENDLSNVHFVDFMSKTDLMKYYQAADVFVLPTREDIWGLVINEAMANGLPIITTNRCIAGLELVRDEVNGYIVAVNDEDRLAQRIRDTFSGNYIEMGKKSLEIVKGYTIEEMAMTHFNALLNYEGLMDSRNNENN